MRRDRFIASEHQNVPPTDHAARRHGSLFASRRQVEKTNKSQVQNRAESFLVQPRTKATFARSKRHARSSPRKLWTPTWVSVEDFEVTLEGRVPRDDACVVEDGLVALPKVVHQREQSCRSSKAQCKKTHDLRIFHIALYILLVRKQLLRTPAPPQTRLGKKREMAGERERGRRWASAGGEALQMWGRLAWCDVGVVCQVCVLCAVQNRKMRRDYEKHL